MKILLAGDHFCRNDILAQALRLDQPHQLTTLTLPWPLEPYHDVGTVREASGTEDQLLDALAGVEICLTQMAPFTARVLEAAKDLRYIGVARGGPVNVDLDVAARLGITVNSAPGRNASATAEHTVALLLAAMRNLIPTHNDLQAGVWRGDYYTYEKVGLELEGRTVGLVGYGAVGSRVAGVLRAFGAEILVYDPYASVVDGPGIEWVELGELLTRSSVISLHARVTEASTGMIGRAELDSMPEGSIVVNCARAALLDYDALCDAIDRGHLAGAALDVYPAEPIPVGARLLSTPGVVTTPHIGGASRRTVHHSAEVLAADLAAFLAGPESTGEFEPS